MRGVAMVLPAVGTTSSRSFAWSRLNVLGCPGMQFSDGTAGQRKRFFVWRACIFPILALALVGVCWGLLTIAGGVWAAGVGLTAICWLPMVMYHCCICRYPNDFRNRMAVVCCYPLLIAGSLVALAEPLSVPLAELGRCAAWLCCWCSCCRSKPGKR